MTDNDNSYGDANESWDENERFVAWRRARELIRHKASVWSFWLERWFTNAEHRYLAVLRGSALIIATVAIVIGLFLAIIGTGMRTGDPNSISSEPVTISADDIVVTLPDEESEASEDDENHSETTPRWQLELPENFRDAYWNTYTENFVPYYREDDEPLERDAFFQEMFPDEALDLISDFPVEDLESPTIPEGFASSQNRLLDGLAITVGDASDSTEIQSQLAAYREAERVRVCRTVQRTRTRYVTGWNPYSTSCPNWYEDYGCATRRAIREPFSERVCSMQFPNEISDPGERMLELQDLYFVTAARRIDEAALDAGDRRAALLQRKRDGAEAQQWGIKAFLAFLATMFLYTIISVERSHRLLARRFQDLREEE